MNLQPACDPFAWKLRWWFWLCHALEPSIPGGPCTPKQSTGSLSNPGSSYCCWQLTPVPSAGGIRWEWMKRSKGANQRRPCCVPYPNRELLEVADGKKIRREKHDREENCLHTSSDKAKTPPIQPSHILPLSLLPVCPSLSTVGPQMHNLNDEWDGKPKASAFCMTRWRGKTSCSRSLTFSAPFPFITKLNFVMKEETPTQGSHWVDLKF